MDYFALKCFVEVVRTGSFSKAAEKLFRTQPAISLQIRKFEEELMEPLLDRYKKQIVLTETGKLIYEEAKDLVNRMEDLKRAASRLSAEPRGTLSIATNLSVINNFLPPFIGKFHERFPMVKVSLLNLKSEGIVRELLEGNADIGVGFLVKETPGIIRQEIVPSEFLLVTNKRAPRPKRSSSPKDLLQGPLVHFEEGVDLRSYIERHLKLKGSLKVVMELPSIESILNYVQQGFGYSILPEYSIPAHWKKELSTRKLGHIIKPITLNAYTHEKRLQSKAAEKFLEIVFSRKRGCP